MNAVSVSELTWDNQETLLRDNAQALPRYVLKRVHFAYFEFVSDGLVQDT